MRTFYPTLVAAAIGVALAAPAQSQTTAPAAPGSGAPVVNQPMKPQTSVTPAAEANNPLTAVRLSKLDGVNIYGADKKKIGEIDDVIVDAKSGKVQYVVVSVGGVMGVGEKKHQVPMSDFKLFSKSMDDSVPARAMLSSAPDSLPAAPKLDRNSPFVEAEDLIGTDIVDAEGKQIGEIEDVVVDLQSGQAQYVLMEFDKSWSPVDKLFAFRMNEFQPAKDKDKLMLGVRKEALENQPSLDKSKFDKTNLTDPAWTARMSQTSTTAPAAK